MHTISTEILINASAKVVRAAVLDFESYPEWNPFVKKVKIISEPEPQSVAERPQAGSQLEVIVLPEGGSQKTFTTEVLVNTPERFQWIGTLVSTWLFSGRHSFDFTKIDDNTTKLIQKEEFVGAFVPLIKYALGGTEEGFNAMNVALKKRVEL
ncbi:unnamed protein product [Kuraishia capsulata CBS 1993]|uniref:Coenzyme Q-binding protein COQ10 START domain-containing protein n=1 Tax=Kuraishia capsulata CBS 1993 TaxID=1382522 RepID=W6MS03_9ASCO|nr:uncharacterized protein KUCA_T00003972001 [Kuraishia capsulata CBS 1993]CDK27992.1 unnamed protein product [Kuraishia capsulata CBS 1993]